MLSMKSDPSASSWFAIGNSLIGTDALELFYIMLFFVNKMNPLMHNHIFNVPSYPKILLYFQFVRNNNPSRPKLFIFLSNTPEMPPGDLSFFRDVQIYFSDNLKKKILQ